ncbi:LOW QUALITY PROTEIN: ribosomal protein S6 kinase delta-1 [Triplophysa dalaica]|uniref:LOW QUALITY PROTEIN: ribosomal protein S6 kinase delta-1 n=1 Tax=Triplophysa dalaica TaxID=1582913 RepID=UPI0024DFDCA7|nr:LOW QUALITY PROTEIN: ribosomal protein S6 kinase delta-1 [Triplophysa dalaica]
MISERDTGELARFYTVTDPTTHRKGYTVYKVTARIISRKNPDEVQEITVWKRYSDFKKLHRDLWQIHKNHSGQSDLFPPFAKAKVFGRFDDYVIEERRQCSEDLLQFSANIPALYGSQYIQDFFKGGEVQDCSELIGPAEPFFDYLADSLSVCSAEGVSSGSQLSCRAVDSDSVEAVVDVDSLTAVDDGMPSSSVSPNHPAARSSPFAVPHPVTFPNGVGVESVRTGGALTFAPSLRNCTGRTDYLEEASEQITLAVEKEVEQEFAAAFSYYHKGVDLLLQGVQGEASPSRREAVKRKTAEYLMRAELISTNLKYSMGQSSTQSRGLGPQCCGVSWSEQTHTEELKHYRVLGIIDKVLLVMDKRTQETFILKGLRKSNECGRVKKTVIPRYVPNMVGLEKCIISEDSIFLLLHYAEGGKLWSHICKYLHNNSPDNSFDIPFIQKPYTTVVCSALSPVPTASSDADSQRGETPSPLPRMSDLSLRECPPVARQPESDGTSEEECTNSYLTLCNEYEQEKVEPDTAEEAEEVTAVTPELNRTCSMMSTGSLCSPISEQELRFFTEEEQSTGSADQSTRSPDFLNQSAPMDLFRIDSKDNEDVCKPIHSEPDVEVSEEPTEENAPDFWRPDDVQGSSELVPVISFKEAIQEDTADSSIVDEAQPPDLLVNLPATEGVTTHTSEEGILTADGALAMGSKPSPTFGRPDVLQRGEDAESDMSVDAVPFGPSEKPLTGSDMHTLSSIKASDGPDSAALRPQADSDKHEDDGSGAEEISAEEDKKVYRLFRELDELAEVALNTRIPEALVRSWAADMVVALDALHQEGIICRDLNPSNILLNHKGHVELTYFCSWNDVEESCDPDAVSKLYCAPEVGGIGEETAACDWWSLGALLFELIVGKSLYHCHPAGISRHSILNIPEFVSDEARCLLEQLLQYNPLERLGSGVAGVEDIKSHPFFSHINLPS